MGDEACALAAIAAGCRFFAGYPITPATEIMEYMANHLEGAGGVFIQMEDEIASMAAIIGASWCGMKSMTATSGPGFSLMQENIGYATMTETPCVIVDVMRSGPGTGQATKGAQGDVYQARYGSHGDYEAIALSPASVQETYDLTIRAFNLSEQFRVPVILLTDGDIGHVREKFVPHVPSIVNRKGPEKSVREFFGYSKKKGVAPMPSFGEGLSVHVTGSSHKADGMRDVVSREVHDELVWGLCNKIRDNADKIVEVKEHFTDDAEKMIISFGASARPSLSAVQKARDAGQKVGLLQLLTIWPFADREIARFSDRELLVVEMNTGMVSREVERVVGHPVGTFLKIGGEAPTASEILGRLEK